jgi:hypothetical protein
MIRTINILAKLLLLTVFLLSSQTINSAQKLQSEYPEEPINISYCELLKEKDKYLGKLVRIKVVWKYGHAVSYISDEKCKAEIRSAISFAEKKNLCEKTEENRKKINNEFYNVTEITIVGRLENCLARCGHLDNLDYKFIVSCLEEAKPIKGNTAR